jgi:DNA-binding NarL/FixJ family response regulator
VLDVSMPEMNGLAATRALLEAVPTLAVVALTRYNDDAYVQALLAAGASGYVLKQSDSTELLQAIRAAAAGQRYLDTALASRVAGAFMARHARRGESTPVRITEREGEVLRLISVGHSNKDIAAQLDVSVKTIEVHKANAMRKLGLRGRIDIVRYAVLHGWLQDP